jgi:hypothetical protein
LGTEQSERKGEESAGKQRTSMAALIAFFNLPVLTLSAFGTSPTIFDATSTSSSRDRHPARWSAAVPLQSTAICSTISSSFSGTSSWYLPQYLSGIT